MRLSLAAVAATSLANLVSANLVLDMMVPKTLLYSSDFNITINMNTQGVPFVQDKIRVGIVDKPDQYNDLTTIGASISSIDLSYADGASRSAFAGNTYSFMKGPVKVRAAIYSIYGNDYMKPAFLPFIDMWEADVVIGDEESKDTVAFKRINQTPKAFDWQKTA